MKRTLVSLSVPVALLGACTSGEAPPSKAGYDVKFPSTAAAVATDNVQLLVFDFRPEDRAVACQNLIQSRKRKEPLAPLVAGPVANICELVRGGRPITVRYGEKAVLAIAIRKGADYMLGCILHTFGDEENVGTRLGVPLALIDVGQPVPDTNCTSVSDFCNLLCKAN